MFYATLDADSEYIADSAHIVAFDTLEGAQKYLADSYASGLDEGETIEFRVGTYGDCWIKSPRDPADMPEMMAPFSADDVIVQRPGQHPGGRYYWLTPRPDVWAAVIVTKAEG